jgi:hypothetical protein
VLAVSVSCLLASIYFRSFRNKPGEKTVCPCTNPLNTLESKMKILALLTVSAAVLVSSSAFAQGLTRAEVRQQLVEAQQNGSEYVTDASYPDVSPAFQNQLAHRQQNANAYGGVSAGSSVSAPRVPMTGTQSHEACVGPVSFCNIYAGS